MWYTASICKLHATSFPPGVTPELPNKAPCFLISELPNLGKVTRHVAFSVSLIFPKWDKSKLDQVSKSRAKLDISPLFTPCPMANILENRWNQSTDPRFSPFPRWRWTSTRPLHLKVSHQFCQKSQWKSQWYHGLWTSWLKYTEIHLGKKKMLF